MPVVRAGSYVRQNLHFMGDDIRRTLNLEILKCFYNHQFTVKFGICDFFFFKENSVFIPVLFHTRVRADL